MICDHRYLDLVDGPRCVLPVHPTNPRGHVYDGDNVPDAHDASEAAAEATR